MPDRAESTVVFRSRHAFVVDTDPHFWVLRLAPVCTGCGGCGGRCEVLGSLSGQVELRLERRSDDPDLRPGQRIELQMNEAGLLRQAWRGYGLPLLGMLCGAWMLNPIGNLPSVMGAVAGTLLALCLSKRLARARGQARPRLHLLDDAGE
ncbi:MAG: SoxR reducing system RseC family protein [Lysobacteraceae bacterium]